MQNNYYFLKKISERLKSKIIDWRLLECYSQNKDELIFGFAGAGLADEFYIRAMLRADFSCLSFPASLHRAKKNSVDLFRDLTGLKVTAVKQYENERSFVLQFEKGYSLLFKMHGNRSNLILFREGRNISIFNSRLPNDLNINLESLDRPLDQSYEAFIAADGDFKALFPTFGKVIRDYIEEQGYENLSLDQKWHIIQGVLGQLNDNNFFIIEAKLPVFSLLSYGDVFREFTEPMEAVSVFYGNWLSRKNIDSERTARIKIIANEIKKDEAYISTTRKRLKKLESENNYRQWADLLMANLHRIKQGEKEAEVDNFYDENIPIIINLNRQLSPQKNAERFYQKAKNQHKEIEVHLQGLLKREASLIKKKSLLNSIEEAGDLKSLREISGSKPIKQKEESKQKPFHFFHIHGYDILVGKSARHNDLLLQHHTKKDDLWLHARDVSGSHVIVRAKGGVKIPEDVIEKAAKLAAYNSKRKSDSLCPVIVTQRKYVRKRKGDPPGAVVVDREDVIMVEPSMDVE